MVFVRSFLTFLTVLSLFTSFIHSAPIEPRSNDFSCRSTSHPNPVILLHGLSGSQYTDLSALELYLKSLGFCTFSLTYGAYPQFPLIGGLKSIDESAKEIAQFIKSVKSGTGSSKIDLVGHSEGGFQALYVPKFEDGISAIVDKIVAIASPTHGTDLSGLRNIAFVGGGVTYQLIRDALDTVGCDACNDLSLSATAVQKLNNGPIVQQGNKVTNIYTSNDSIVTPPKSTCPINEPGVKNILVQKQCLFDPVGHVGLSFDTYVWGLVANSLDSSIPTKPCSFGLPF